LKSWMKWFLKAVRAGSSVSLSEKKKLLLYKGAQNNGVVSMGMAESLYSSKSSAKSAITSLEFEDYLERHVPGYFKIVKLPEEVKRKLDDSDDGESDYVEEQV